MSLSRYDIILASNSPRRKELLAGLDLDYKIVLLPDIDESYPPNIRGESIAEYVAVKKAKAYELEESTLLITADTIVLLGDEVLGKPKDGDEAKKMLTALSGRTHIVATGVCISTKEKRKSFVITSEVRFAPLDKSEIDYYVDKYKPLDKAGAYGVQEWIGYIAVEYISGSYFNIMGLPVQRLYQELKKFSSLE